MGPLQIAYIASATLLLNQMRASAAAATAVGLLELERLEALEARIEEEEHVEEETRLRIVEANEERARRHIRLRQRKARRVKQVDQSKPQ